MKRYSVKLVNDPYPRRPGVEKNDQGPLVMYEDAQSAIAAKDAEIAKLRAEADSEKRRASGWSAAAVTQRKRAEDAEAALAAARAALDGERGRADSYRESHKPTSGCVDRIYAGGVLGPIQIDNRCGLCKAHDKLRAADIDALGNQRKHDASKFPNAEPGFRFHLLACDAAPSLSAIARAGIVHREAARAYNDALVNGDDCEQAYAEMERTEAEFFRAIDAAEGTE